MSSSSGLRRIRRGNLRDHETRLVSYSEVDPMLIAASDQKASARSTTASPAMPLASPLLLLRRPVEAVVNVAVR